MRQTILLPLLLPLVLFAQTVSLSAFPKPRQLYGRDSQDSAIVPVAGTVRTAGLDSVSVILYRNGIIISRTGRALQYTGDSASFSFSPKIHAERSSYKFELHVAASLAATSDSVLCGDAYLVDGQSNAANAEIIDYATYPVYSPWLRTFSIVDTAWHRTNSSAWGCGKHIIDHDSMPVCFINGAVPGTTIASHQRDTSLSSIYGKILFRIRRAGLQNNIKAVIWDQGESNSNDANYKNEFLTLCASWKSDFPGIQRYYLFQVRPGCYLSNGGDVLLEQQRQIPQGRPDISIMSTNGIPNHDGCHYYGTGYFTMGEQMCRLLERDFYGSTDTVNIRPPDIQKACFADSARKELVLLFDQPVLLPPDTVRHLPVDTTLRRYFAIDGKWAVAESLQADTAAHTLTLFLKAPAEGTTVTYPPSMADPFLGTTFEGPWLYNKRNIGALAFVRFPITDPDPLDSLTPTAMEAYVSDTLVEQYDTTRVYAIVHYGTVLTDTTEKECLFFSLNTFQAEVSPYGQVLAKNTGLARIRVGKRGLWDTVTIRITASTATLDSIRLSKHEKNVALLGFTMTATGFFSRGAERFSANIDTVATWTSGAPSVVSVVKGVVKHVAGSLNAPIPVSATLQGKSDTCAVTAPWQVPRGDMSVVATGTPYGTGNTAINTIDSTRATWISSSVPQSLTVSFTRAYRIDKLFYLPWQDSRLNGVITSYRILTSLDSVTFDTVATGTWSADLDPKDATFTARDARHVRFTAVAARNGYINADEIGFERVDTGSTGVAGPGTFCTTEPEVSPNPFNPSLTLHYALAKEAAHSIVVYAVNGKKIRTLQQGIQKPGHYRVLWDGKNEKGASLAGGVYILKITTGKQTSVKRVTFLK
ncbi:MAG: discoidin domain-containing protein [Fibrobacterota bacterium]